MMGIGKILVVAGLFVWCLSPVRHTLAEDGTGGVRQGERAPERDTVARRLETTTRRLGLSPDQQATLRQILEEEAARLKELKADEERNPVEFREKARKLRTGTFNRIRAILTPEQQQKEEALRREASERRKKNGGT